MYSHYNQIYLAGPCEFDDSFVCSEDVKPGMHLELHVVSGKRKWRKCSSATEAHQMAIALDFPLVNIGISDTYVAGDQVRVGIMGSGAFFNGLMASGEDIAEGEYISPKGDGLFKGATTTTAAGNVARIKSHEPLGVVAANTLCMLECLY